MSSLLGSTIDTQRPSLGPVDTHVAGESLARSCQVRKCGPVLHGLGRFPRKGASARSADVPLGSMKISAAKTESVMTGRPQAYKDAAMFMVQKYGARAAMTSAMAISGKTGPSTPGTPHRKQEKESLYG